MVITENIQICAIKYRYKKPITILYLYFNIHICVCLHTTFPLYVFFVCLLCAGVKTDTKRDVALQGEKRRERRE